MTNVVFFFVEHLPEHGRKRPKHARSLPYVCMPLYPTVVQCWNKHCNKHLLFFILRYDQYYVNRTRSMSKTRYVTLSSFVNDTSGGATNTGICVSARMVKATCISCENNIHALYKVKISKRQFAAANYDNRSSPLKATSRVVSGHTLKSSTFVNINEF